MKQNLLAVFAAIGLFISLYFLLLSFKTIVIHSSHLPSFCRLDQKTCERILSHPDARLLGVPNFVLGAVYYTLVLMLGVGFIHPLFEMFLRAVSWGTVGVAVYLTYSLSFKIRTTCLLCLASHIVSLFLSIILTFW